MKGVAARKSARGRGAPLHQAAVIRQIAALVDLWTGEARVASAYRLPGTNRPNVPTFTEVAYSGYATGKFECATQLRDLIALYDADDASVRSQIGLKSG